MSETKPAPPTPEPPRCKGCGRVAHKCECEPEPAPEAPRCDVPLYWRGSASDLVTDLRGALPADKLAEVARLLVPAPEAPCAECVAILRDADGGNVEGAQEWVNAGQHLPGCSLAQPAPEAASERDPLEYVLNRMEHAALHDNPSEHGYGAARRELLAGIAALREQLAEAQRVLPCGHHHSLSDAYGTCVLCTTMRTANEQERAAHARIGEIVAPHLTEADGDVIPFEAKLANALRRLSAGPASPSTP